MLRALLEQARAFVAAGRTVSDLLSLIQRWTDAEETGVIASPVFRELPEPEPVLLSTGGGTGKGSGSLFPEIVLAAIRAPDSQWDALFEDFWRRGGRVGGKQAAFRRWRTLRPSRPGDEQERYLCILRVLRQRQGAWKARGFGPHLSTFLNAESFALPDVRQLETDTSGYTMEQWAGALHAPQTGRAPAQAIGTGRHSIAALAPAQRVLP